MCSNGQCILSTDRCDENVFPAVTCACVLYFMVYDYYVLCTLVTVSCSGSSFRCSTDG